MDDLHRESAHKLRAALEAGAHAPSRFRAALLEVPPLQRDAWLDTVLGLGELPDDGPELPSGCVPYLPCPVEDLLRVVEHAVVRASDVFVDIGSGIGRTGAFVHLLTGAAAIGIEVQPRLVLSARALAARLSTSRMPSIQGDAAALARFMVIGTVFFLYCPFSGARLATLLADLEPIARTRSLRICCVDTPLPSRPWLTLEASPRDGIEIYRSTCAALPARVAV